MKHVISKLARSRQGVHEVYQRRDALHGTSGWMSPSCRASCRSTTTSSLQKGTMFMRCENVVEEVRVIIGADQLLRVFDPHGHHALWEVDKPHASLRSVK